MPETVCDFSREDYAEPRRLAIRTDGGGVTIMIDTAPASDTVPPTSQ